MRRAVISLIFAAALGCGGTRSQAPDARPLPATDQLDMLFVIDNSGTSAELQAALAQAFPGFTQQLASRFGGELPDLHIGVVSGNLGVGGFTIPACDNDGDGGRLQNSAQGACEPPSDLWISDRPNGSGGRVRNSPESLEATFACISRLGSDGCSFQQHLGALRAALDGRHSEHLGFLRENALLATVTVADDDDCTASDSALFQPDPAPETDLGPLSSGRCARFGWTCDGQEIPQEAATYTSCEPRGDSYLIAPADTAAFLEGLKSDPRRVLASAVVADRTPAIFEVVDGATRQVNICGEFPHSTNIRDRHLVDATDGLWIDGCDADLGPGLRELADSIADRMGAAPR